LNIFFISLNIPTQQLRSRRCLPLLFAKVRLFKQTSTLIHKVGGDFTLIHESFLYDPRHLFYPPRSMMAIGLDVARSLCGSPPLVGTSDRDYPIRTPADKSLRRCLHVRSSSSWVCHRLNPTISLFSLWRQPTALSTPSLRMVMRTLRTFETPNPPFNQSVS
jgi:hypothetical protein